MKRLTRLFFICLMALCVTYATETRADERQKTKQHEEQPDTSQLLKNYLHAIETLAKERDSLNTNSAYPAPNAYYYQILSNPALYSSSLHQALGQTDTSNPDPQLQRIFASRKMLSTLYARAPQFVPYTESDILGQAGIRSDINDMLQVSDKLADKVAAATLLPDIDEQIGVITRRPNFWKFSGTTSLQFAQNYISDNWYKGGETNWIGNFDLTLHANYNDQRKITWENTLDAQLGFGDRRKAHFPTEPQPSSLHWQCRLQGLEELVLLSTGHSADPDCTQLSEKHR